jgi:hypothetical protein
MIRSSKAPLDDTNFAKSCPLVCATPAIPPWIGSVSAIDGEVAVAKLDPRKLPHLAARLLVERISYYWPKETVKSQSNGGGEKVWERSVFSGTIFVDIGRYDRRENKDAADNYCRYFGWHLSWLKTGSGATQSLLRRDLESVESVIRSQGGWFFPVVPIRPGQRVRITSGAFVDVQGTVIEEDGEHMVQIGVSLLGQGTPLKIARELVERV